jgi:hypothetical protein
VNKLKVTVWGVFGVILGAASLISLTVRAFDVGLADLPAEIIQYYRWFITEVIRRPLFDLWMQPWLGWSIPAWVFDVLLIWSLFAAGVARIVIASGEYLNIKRWAELVFKAPIIWCYLIYILSKDAAFGAFSLFAQGVKEAGKYKNYKIVLWRSGHAINVIVHGFAYVVLGVGPIILTFAFFLWNAILLTPAL